MKKIDDIKHYISVKGSFTKFAGPNCSAFPELSDLFYFQIIPADRSKIPLQDVNKRKIHPFDSAPCIKN